MNSQSLAIDHLMWGGADLDSAIDILASHTGCRAAAGGSHPGNGTRNALLGLGGERYLEVIAPDPTQSAGAGLAAELAAMQQPALRTWAVRSGSLEAVAAQLNAHGISTAAPRAMSRRAIDGTLLQWRLLFAQDRSLGGVLPFFIDCSSSTGATQRIQRQHSAASAGWTRCTLRCQRDMCSLAGSRPSTACASKPVHSQVCKRCW